MLRWQDDMIASFLGLFFPAFSIKQNQNKAKNQTQALARKNLPNECISFSSKAEGNFQPSPSLFLGALEKDLLLGSQVAIGSQCRIIC